jgi:hypothetical protein
LRRLKGGIIADDGERINGPLLLIKADNPHFIPQFERIAKGLYYNKFKKPLPQGSSIQLIFPGINDFEIETGFVPTWDTIERDVFRSFLHTEEENDTSGIVGLLFYENLFCLGFFNEKQ